MAEKYNIWEPRQRFPHRYWIDSTFRPKIGPLAGIQRLSPENYFFLFFPEPYKNAKECKNCQHTHRVLQEGHVKVVENMTMVWMVSNKVWSPFYSQLSP